MKRKILNMCIIFFSGAWAVFLIRQFKKKSSKNVARDKYFLYYDVLNKWMKQKENGVSVAETLMQRGIHEIAIYGMADMGRHLQCELVGTDIVIKYAIDRSFFVVSDLDVYLPDSELPQVDAVIVTPVFDYESIRNHLKQKLSCPILSLADLFGEDGKTLYES